MQVTVGGSLIGLNNRAELTLEAVTVGELVHTVHSLYPAGYATEYRKIAGVFVNGRNIPEAEWARTSLSADDKVTVVPHQDEIFQAYAIRAGIATTQSPLRLEHGLSRDELREKGDSDAGVRCLTPGVRYGSERGAFYSVVLPQGWDRDMEDIAAHNAEFVHRFPDGVERTMNVYHTVVASTAPHEIQDRPSEGEVAGRKRLAKVGHLSGDPDRIAMNPDEGARQFAGSRRYAAAYVAGRFFLMQIYYHWARENGGHPERLSRDGVKGQLDVVLGPSSGAVTKGHYTRCYTFQQERGGRQYKVDELPADFDYGRAFEEGRYKVDGDFYGEVLDIAWAMTKAYFADPSAAGRDVTPAWEEANRDPANWTLTSKGLFDANGAEIVTFDKPATAGERMTVGALRDMGTVHEPQLLNAYIRLVGGQGVTVTVAAAAAGVTTAASTGEVIAHAKAGADSRTRTTPVVYEPEPGKSGVADPDHGDELAQVAAAEDKVRDAKGPIAKALAKRELAKTKREIYRAYKKGKVKHAESDKVAGRGKSDSYVGQLQSSLRQVVTNLQKWTITNGVLYNPEYQPVADLGKGDNVWGAVPRKGFSGDLKTYQDLLREQSRLKTEMAQALSGQGGAAGIAHAKADKVVQIATPADELVALSNQRDNLLAQWTQAQTDLTQAQRLAAAGDLGAQSRIEGLQIKVGQLLVLLEQITQREDALNFGSSSFIAHAEPDKVADGDWSFEMPRWTGNRAADVALVNKALSGWQDTVYGVFTPDGIQVIDEDGLVVLTRSGEQARLARAYRELVAKKEELTGGGSTAVTHAKADKVADDGGSATPVTKGVVGEDGILLVAAPDTGDHVTVTLGKEHAGEMVEVRWKPSERPLNRGLVVGTVHETSGRRKNLEVKGSQISVAPRPYEVVCTVNSSVPGMLMVEARGRRGKGTISEQIFEDAEPRLFAALSQYQRVRQTDLTDAVAALIDGEVEADFVPTGQDVVTVLSRLSDKAPQGTHLSITANQLFTYGMITPRMIDNIMRVLQTGENRADLIFRYANLEERTQLMILGIPEQMLVAADAKIGGIELSLDASTEEDRRAEPRGENAIVVPLVMRNMRERANWYRAIDEVVKRLNSMILDANPTAAAIADQFGTVNIYIGFSSETARERMKMLERLSKPL